MGNTESKRRRGPWRMMRWLDSISASVDLNFSKLWETVKDRRAWPCCHPRGCRVRHNLATNSVISPTYPPMLSYRQRASYLLIFVSSVVRPSPKSSKSWKVTSSQSSLLPWRFPGSVCHGVIVLSSEVVLRACVCPAIDSQCCCCLEACEHFQIMILEAIWGSR